MFEGDSADTSALKFLVVSIGGRAEGQTRERGPPSALAEIFSIFFKCLKGSYCCKSSENLSKVRCSSQFLLSACCVAEYLC